MARREAGTMRDDYPDVLDGTKYAGQWVAYRGKKVVAANAEFAKVFAEARRYSAKPFIVRVPENMPMLF